MVKTGSQLRLFFVFFIFIFFNISLEANFKVNTSVSPQEVEVGEVFKVSVSLSGSAQLSIPSLDLKIPGAVKVGTSTSSSFQFGTGGAQRTLTYELSYQAQKQGRLKVPSVTIDLKGNKFKTQEAYVKVVPQDPSKPKKKTARSNRGGSTFSSLFQNFFDDFDSFSGLSGGLSGEIDEDNLFFIKAEVDKTEVWEGEPILVTWYLYTQGRLLDIDTLKYPDLNDFWKEDIELATRLNFVKKDINGTMFNRALLAKYALFPIKNGTVVIDPYRVKSTILTGKGRKTETKESLSVPINVKPLPVDAPEGFTGGVGQFRVSAKIEDRTIIQHQPFYYVIRFDGRGNAKLIEAPDLKLPESFEVYDVETSMQFFKNGGSYKQFKYSIIPRDYGDLGIPKVNVSYFDPMTGQYIKKSIPQQNFKVLKGVKQQQARSSHGDQSLDLKVIKPASEFISSNSNWKTSSFYIWGIGSIGVFLFSFLNMIFLKLKKPTTESLKEMVDKKIEKIKKLSSNKQADMASAEAVNLIYKVMGDISGLDGAHMEFEELFRRSPYSVRQSLEKPMSELLKGFEGMAFRPNKEDLYHTLTPYIVKLEATLKKAIDLSIK